MGKPKSRGNGEGTIYFDAKKRLYRAAVTLPDGTRSYVSAKTRKATNEKLIALQNKVAEDQPTGRGEPLGTFLHWWLDSLEVKAANESKSVNTVDNARWAVKNWIEPALGSKRLRDLQPEHVERMLIKMAKSGLARRSIARVKSYLGQALDVAQRRGKVNRNAARLAEMPATEPPEEGKSLTPDEAKRVLEAARGDRLEALFVTALMQGLRPGELMGLQWSQVELTAGVLNVSVALKQERGQVLVGEPKTPRSKRPLTFPGRVVAALKMHRKRQLEERLAAGEVWEDNGFVFTDEIGRPLDRWKLRRAINSVLDRAGVGHVSPNEFGRHSAASLLYDAGVPLDVIADVLGHTSTRMLDQTYRHRVRPSISGHVAAMEEIFGEG